MCYYEGIYRNRFGRSFGSHPQANIDEMLVPRGFPREMMRARSGWNLHTQQYKTLILKNINHNSNATSIWSDTISDTAHISRHTLTASPQKDP
jgi:hypothetical protein